MSRILSGIQPSGLQHLGNYFGAIQQQVAMQEEHEVFYFLADYHALTTVKDPAQLREWTHELAVTYLACGLDPEKATMWRQSDVPEVTEITWLLATVTGLGLLERGHSYKDKVAQGLKPNVGLLFYPVLMAADILAYDAEWVPVGKDQVQHIEMTQDMAGFFNNTYAEVFRRPEWQLSKTPKVLGLDGQKMSKSYGNHVWLFEEGKKLKKTINRIQTDSRPPEEPKEPDEMLIFDWLGLFLEADELADLKKRCREGGENGPGYGELKQRLRDAIETHFAPARARRAELLAHPKEVERVLAAGAEKARAVARATRDRAYAACGLR